jgi:hypothetical protein
MADAVHKRAVFLALRNANHAANADSKGPRRACWDFDVINKTAAMPNAIREFCASVYGQLA